MSELHDEPITGDSTPAAWRELLDDDVERARQLGAADALGGAFAGPDLTPEKYGAALLLVDCLEGALAAYEDPRDDPATLRTKRGRAALRRGMKRVPRQP